MITTAKHLSKQEKPTHSKNSFKKLLIIPALAGILGTAEAKPLAPTSPDPTLPTTQIMTGLNELNNGDTLQDGSEINLPGTYTINSSDLMIGQTFQTYIFLENIEDSNGVVNYIFNGGSVNHQGSTIATDGTPFVVLDYPNNIIIAGSFSTGSGWFAVNGASNPRLITSTDTLKASELPNGEIEITPNQTITIQASKIFWGAYFILGGQQYPTGNANNLMTQNNGYWEIELTGQDIINFTGSDSTNFLVLGKTHTGGSWLPGVEGTIKVVPAPIPDTTVNEPQVAYSTVTCTNGSVIATLSFDEPVTVTTPGWTATDTSNQIFTKEYFQNTTPSDTVRYVDTANNQGSVEVFIPNIDTQLDQPFEISYSPNTWTNGAVTATLKFDEAVSISTPGWTATDTSNKQFTKLFTTNTTERIDFADCINQEDTIVTVSNIDKTLPSVTLTQTPTSWTNGTVTITATATDNDSGIKDYRLNSGAWQTGNQFTVSANGDYTVSVRDSAGNTVDEITEIRNIDKNNPTLSLTQTSTTGMATIIATAGDSESGLPAQPYSFDSGQNWTATNEFTVFENGVYYVIARDKAGNQTEDSITVFIGTGIEEVKKSDFNMYPNPAKQLLTLETEEPISAIQIMDMTGRVVLNQKRLTNNTVDVSALANGMYVIRIYMPTGYSERKLIKQ